MTDSNDNRFGVSPQEYRRLIGAFKRSTLPETRARIFRALLNDQMYAEFASIARRYKRERGQLPDVETYSVVDNYVNTLLRWWYDDPEQIVRFDDLGQFIAYSRVSLQRELLAKLKRGGGKGKGSELTNQEDAPEPSSSDEFIAEIVGQDAFDELFRQIKEMITEIELETFLARALEEMTFEEIAKRLSNSSNPPRKYTADQVRAIYVRAVKKIRRGLQNWDDDSV